MAEKKSILFLPRSGNESGLTENTITDLFQDSDGYIWIGTNNGLFKYDGYRCKVYRNRPDSTNTLGDNTISCIERRQPAKHLDHNRTSCTQNRQAKPTNT